MIVILSPEHDLAREVRENVTFSGFQKYLDFSEIFNNFLNSSVFQSSKTKISNFYLINPESSKPEFSKKNPNFSKKNPESLEKSSLKNPKFKNSVSFKTIPNLKNPKS